MPLSWEYGPTTFTVEGGVPSVVELRVPDRGVINNIRLAELNGGAHGGTFRIFHKEAAADAVVGTSESSLIAGDDPDLYSVVGQKTIVAGKHESYGLNCHYRSGVGSNPSRRLWLVIEPNAAGDIEYGLSMTIVTDL